MPCDRDGVGRITSPKTLNHILRWELMFQGIFLVYIRKEKQFILSPDKQQCRMYEREKMIDGSDDSPYSS